MVPGRSGKSWVGHGARFLEESEEPWSRGWWQVRVEPAIASQRLTLPLTLAKDGGRLGWAEIQGVAAGNGSGDTQRGRHTARNGHCAKPLSPTGLPSGRQHRAWRRQRAHPPHLPISQLGLCFTCPERTLPAALVLRSVPRPPRALSLGSPRAHQGAPGLRVSRVSGSLCTPPDTPPPQEGPSREACRTPPSH